MTGVREALLRCPLCAAQSPLAVILIAMAIGGSSPVVAHAQYLAHSTVGVRTNWTDRDARQSIPLPELVPTQPDTGGRAKAAYVVGGIFVGALAGAFLASSFRSDFCGEPSPGVTCSATSTGEGLVIGAAVGALVGWIAWSSTRPARLVNVRQR